MFDIRLRTMTEST